MAGVQAGTVVGRRRAALALFWNFWFEAPELFEIQARHFSFRLRDLALASAEAPVPSTYTVFFNNFGW
jgi:hypothetical protein